MVGKLTIGVTGATGFIGRYVVEELTRRGYKVVAVDHAARKTDDDAEMLLADVRDRTAMFEMAAHVDGVIHLAAVLGTQETIANPLPAAETNILGGLNVLDACRQYNLPLVYAGVGNYWMRNTYSTTKTALENLLIQYRDEFGLPFAIVRPVNAYGPRQRVANPFGPGKVRKILPAFICRALCEMPIEIYGDGTQISDMVHVRDVARVFRATLESMLETLVPPQLPIEVGPIESCTVNDVARMVLSEVRDLGLPTIDELKYLPMRPGEKENSSVAPKALANLIRRTETEFSEVEASQISAVLRTLTNIVRADLKTLNQIGIDPAEFTLLSTGVRETVNWYHQKQGIEWSNPTTEK